MVDPGERLADIGRQRVRVHQAGDRDVGGDCRDDNGRDQCRAILHTDTGDPAIGDQNLVHLTSQPQLPSVRGEQFLEMCCESADPAA